jgi:hypothetical protein
MDFVKATHSGTDTSADSFDAMKLPIKANDLIPNMVTLVWRLCLCLLFHARLIHNHRAYSPL